MELLREWVRAPRDIAGNRQVLDLPKRLLGADRCVLCQVMALASAPDLSLPNRAAGVHASRRRSQSGPCLP